MAMPMSWVGLGVGSGELKGGGGCQAAPQEWRSLLAGLYMILCQPEVGLHALWMQSVLA